MKLHLTLPALGLHWHRRDDVSASGSEMNIEAGTRCFLLSVAFAVLAIGPASGGLI
jgi:hypothetical protein